MTDQEKTLHPVSEYIMQDDIGLVMAKGLSVVYKEKPQNPVDFFAKWLLLQAQIKKKEAADAKAERLIQLMRDKKAFQESVEKKQAEEKALEEAEALAKKNAFYQKVEKASDLNDHLQDLVAHIAENTGATAVYVGKVVKPIKGIKDGLKEDEYDTDHIIKAAKSQIEFKNASPSEFKFLEGKILMQDEGVTYKLFNQEENNAKNPNIIDENDKLGIPKHIFIQDVVREKDMFYYQVPRLGSYLAIRLEYNSCLFETSYDAAVENYKEVDQLNKDQEDERRAYEEEQAEIKKAKEDEDEEYSPGEKTWTPYQYAPFKTQKVQFVVCLNTMGQDKDFTQEQKEYALSVVKHYRESWEKIETANLKKDVLQKTANLEFDRNYKDYWETQDNAELERKIQLAIDAATNDKNAEGDEISEEEKDDIRRHERHKQLTITFFGPQELEEWKMQQEALGNQSVHPPSSQPGGAPMSSEQDHRQPSQMSGSIKESQMKSSKEAVEEVDLGPPYNPMVPQMWQSQIMQLSDVCIIKYRRIFQSLFYLLQFNDRETICTKETNMLEWKKCRNFLKINMENQDTNNIFKKMSLYNPFGPKEGEYLEYQKLHFIRSNIEQIDPELVDEYSVAVGRLLRWLLSSIELRIEDVSLRRKKKTERRQEREEAIEREQERVEKRESDVQEKVDAAEQMHEEAQEKAGASGAGEEAEAQEGEEEAEEFDAEAYKAAETEKFDEEYPPIDIPEEIIDDIDNDHNVEDEESMGQADD